VSICLSVVKKDKTNFKIQTIVGEYLEALESSYTSSEMEAYVYGKRGGVIGLVFENSNLSEQETETLIIKKHTLNSKTITTIKLLHKDSVESRKQLLTTLKNMGNLQSSFVLLEHTVMLNPEMRTRPPRLTTGGKIYLPVGGITNYFLDNKQQKEVYAEEFRGIEFAKTIPGGSETEIIKAYYSKFLDSGEYEKLTKAQHTGLAHFTTVLTEESNRLAVYFLQNKQKLNTAKYFFDPDYVFCSDESVLRTFRHLHYPGKDLPIRRNLQQMIVELP